MRILGVIAASLTVLLAAALIALLSVDFGIFRTQINKLASDALGRTVTINELQISLGRELRIIAGDATVASPSWSEQPVVLAADRIEVATSIDALLRDTPSIELVAIDGLSATLETNHAGDNNWDLPRTEPDSETEASANTLRRIPLLVDQLTLNSARISYRSPELERPLDAQLNLEQALSGQNYLSDLTGTINETPIALTVTTTPVDQLIEFGQTSFIVDGTFGEIALSSTLALKSLLDPSHPELALNITGPSVEYLTDKLGMRRITTGKLEINGRIYPLNDRMSVDVDAEIGEFLAELGGHFDNLQSLENGSVDVSLSGPNVAHIAELFDQEGAPAVPFALTGSLVRTGKRLNIDSSELKLGQAAISVTGIIPDLESPMHANLSAKVTIVDAEWLSTLLDSPVTPEGPLTLAVTAASGEESTQVSGSLDSDYGQLSFGGDLTREANLAGSIMTLTGGGDDVGELLALLQPELRTGPLQQKPMEPDTPLHGKWTLSTTLNVEDNYYLLQQSRLNLVEDSLQFDGRVNRIFTPLDAKFAVDIALTDVRQHVATFTDQATAKRIPEGAGALRGNLIIAGDEVTLEDTELSMTDLRTRVRGESNLTTGASEARFDIRSENPTSWVPLDLVPANVNPLSLEQALAISGRATYSDGRLLIEDTSFSLGETRVTGKIAFAEDLDRGELDLKANSEDIFVFSNTRSSDPALAELPLEGAVKLAWKPGEVSVQRINLTTQDGSAVTAAGTLRFGDSFDGTDFDLNLNLASLRRAGRFIGQELPPEPFEFSGSLAGSVGFAEARRFSIRVGESTATGSVKVSNPDHPSIDLSINAQKLDLRPFITPPGEQPEQPEAPTTKPVSNRFIPDLPIDLSPLASFDTRTNISIKQLIGHTRSLRDVKLAGSVEAGALTISTLKIKDESGGAIELAGKASSRNDTNQLSIEIKGNNINLGYPATTPEQVALLPRLDINSFLFGEGNTTRELAANISGFVEVNAGEGKVARNATSILTNDFIAELLALINPLREKEEYNDVVCVALLAKIDQGKVRGEPLVTAATKKLRVFAEGKADLKTEKIFATFNTVPMKGFGISAAGAFNPFIGVAGTLKKPALTLDPQGTLVQGSLTVASGGLWLLAKNLTDRITQSNDPCGEAVTAGTKDRPKLYERYQEFTAVPSAQ